MPERNISKHASDVNKLEITQINGQRSLCHNGEPVKSTTKDEAFLSFIDYIARVSDRNGDNENNGKNIPVKTYLYLDIMQLFSISPFFFVLQALHFLNQ